ncbi:MAG: FadR family transcriptional regulator [Deltaproteobacteria bacterium]|jgi:GntR family transcriptional regulator, transcriptional repressor for pyruvate dehydrogenase complex|nr:FadR family transcriptional regulator [Deltaproteobacteria bacterium]MBT4642272.1 FadR family transcriptional regulator [Deltaproteobacteria bacterium]MBT6502536.1 FadR family transcriptional regulator [Deltaproteobacteria bacterium]MBT6613171.1 FadR family transcriptional regulator [Deltaproteobacteria bacterium]MBT7715246.1 FadR family transcriptional regulator [Deltaproteobacteria bacterium]
MTQNTKRSLSEKIMEWIEEQIVSKEWKEGDKLPSEKELCGQFSVSRIVVREALSKLYSKGLTRPEHGKGHFVSMKAGIAPFIRANSPHTGDMETSRQILEVLIAFESAAAKLAATNRNKKDLLKIEKELLNMEYAFADDQLGHEEDYLFHRAIFEATHNPLYCDLSDFFENGIRKLIRHTHDIRLEKRSGDYGPTQIEHRQIFEAIRDQDPEKAYHVAETHLQNAAERLFN